MKMKKLAVLVVAMTFGLAANSFAVSPPKTTEQKPATPVEMGSEVDNLVFTGTVKKIPNGTALITKDATYLLTGGDFESIIGKEVNIIGKVIKEGSIEKIQVARAQLAQE